MAVSQEQKVDFLLKKIGFTASKTGIAVDSSLSGTKKAGFAEAIPSPLVIASTSVWADSSFIPATPPGSDSAFVKVYLSGTSGLRMTHDSTVSGQRSFVARSTYGNQTSAILGDWIDTQFSADYIIKVYKGDPNSGGVQLSAAGSGSNDGWFFDYSSGILNFNDTNVPSGVTDTNIYIVGYRYTGTKGLQPPAGIGTFSSLDVTGIATFRNDVNFLGANYNIQFDQSADALDFADNAKARFGSSDDLSIYHSSSTNNSIISNSTGILQILGDDVRIKNAANNADLARFIGGAAATLYHNNTARIYTTATGAEVAGNLNVTGVLTYDDVTNIDSIGIVTARTGIHVLANGMNVVGVTTFANTMNIGSGQRINVGTTNNAIYGNTSSLNIDVSGSGNLLLRTNASGGAAGKIKLQAKSSEESIVLTPDAGADIYYDNTKRLATSGIGVTIYTQLDVTNINATGVITAAQFTGPIVSPGFDITARNLNISGLSTFAGAIDANGDLDVDGHTELDNVNISGVATVASAKVSDLTSGRVVYAGTGGELQDHAGLTFDGSDLVAASAKITDLTSGRVVLAGTSGALQDNGNLTFNGSLLNVTGNLDVSGNVSIAGTLTYQDVTNVDSIGIATARTGLHVLANGIVVNAGVSTFAAAIDANSNVDVAGDLDVDGHTDLDNVSISGVTTTAGLLDINAGGQANTFKVEDLTDNRVVVAGTGGELEDSANLTFDGTTLAVTGNATVSGNVDLGDATSDTITATGRFDSHLVPSADNTYDLGTSSLEWRHVYAKNIGIGTTGGSGIGDDIVTRNLKVTGLSTFQGNMHLDSDWSNLRFGTGQGDLNIKNDSSNNAYIQHMHGGNTTLYVRSDGEIKFEQYSGGPHDTFALFKSDGAVSLYYNGGKRFETSGIGVTITGETKTTNLNVTGIATFTGLADINGGGQANTFKVEDLTAGRVVLAGTGGEIEDSGNLTFNGTKLEVTGTTDTDQLVVSGVSTFTGAADFNGDIDVDGHTELDNLRVSGVSTLTGNVITSADVSFTGASYNAKWITSGDKLRFNDNASATFGTQDDLQIYHNNTSGYIRNTSGNLRIQPKSGEQGIILKPDGAIETYYDNSKKISTSGIGVTVYNQLDVTNINATGVITATKFVGGGTIIGDDLTTRNLSVTGLSTFTGAIDANGDLDVDGHAEFDNIRVAGVSTFAGQLNAGAIAAASATFTGNVTVGGTLTYEDVTNVDSVGIVTARTDLHVGTGATTIKTLNGKVGINSTVPVHTLDVGGVINSSTDIRINNVSVGGGASLDDVTALAIALG